MEKIDTDCSNSAYYRIVWKKTEYCEVVFILWPPGSESPLHDHGCSFGSVRVLGGTLHEERYSKGKNVMMNEKVYVKGDVFYEYPDTIHKMSNRSKRWAVTLHVYIPPCKMGYYKK